MPPRCFWHACRMRSSAWCAWERTPSLSMAPSKLVRRIPSSCVSRCFSTQLPEHVRIHVSGVSGNSCGK